MAMGFPPAVSLEKPTNWHPGTAPPRQECDPKGSKKSRTSLWIEQARRLPYISAFICYPPTAIYTHVLNRGPGGIISPEDRL